MSKEETNTLISTYYDAFNRGDMLTFLDLLDDQIRHDINQHGIEIGKKAFEKFMLHMNQCYKERITDLVIFIDEKGQRAAAEFMVEGVYLVTDNGFPPAKNQFYRLPAGAFFEIHNNKIKRITNYYNVKEWLQLISE